MGVCPDRDNVWANSPSLVLHSWDEGQVEKFCTGSVRWAIHDGARHGYSATEVRRQIDRAFAETYNERPLNSNVEVNGRDCFQLFPHGVCGYLLDKRRLNAKWYGPLTDQLQMFLMGSDLLTPTHKSQMAELAHMIRQITFMIRQPLKRAHGIEEFQEYIDTFLGKMVRYTIFHTPSECKSIKFHCGRHWREHRRQLGCSAMEYSLERALGDHFTKFWSLTNHGQHGAGKDMQLAAIVHRHSCVADLCYHANVNCDLRQNKSALQKTTANFNVRTTTVQLPLLTFLVSSNGDTKYRYETTNIDRIVRAKIRESEAGLVFPMAVTHTMRIPLPNRCIKKEDTGRLQVLTLRARKNYYGKKRYDNIMLLVHCEPKPCGRTVDILFARCLAFLRDKANNHFVVVHWYEKALSRNMHNQARLGKVKPMKMNHHHSYDIMPVGAILNGALLVQDRGMYMTREEQRPHFWVRTSPREYNFLLEFYGERQRVPNETILQRDGISL